MSLTKEDQELYIIKGSEGIATAHAKWCQQLAKLSRKVVEDAIGPKFTPVRERRHLKANNSGSFYASVVTNGHRAALSFINLSSKAMQIGTRMNASDLIFRSCYPCIDGNVHGPKVRVCDITLSGRTVTLGKKETKDGHLSMDGGPLNSRSLAQRLAKGTAVIVLKAFINGHARDVALDILAVKGGKTYRVSPAM